MMATITKRGSTTPRMAMIPAMRSMTPKRRGVRMGTHMATLTATATGTITTGQCATMPRSPLA
jgi:hypothetical protein